MKTRRDKITPRNSVNSKIYKLKHGHRNCTKRSWGLGSNITLEKLDNLNEVIRVNKTQRAEGIGTFRLVPKDSCEVYKDRYKRKMNKRIEDNERESVTNETKHTTRRPTTRRQSKINRRGKLNTRKTKRKRVQLRKPSNTSADDSESYCTCESLSLSSTSTARSSASSSDMEL